MTDHPQAGAPGRGESAEVAVTGVGRLAEVIGVDEARAFFEERDARKQFLYGRAVRRWTNPSGVGARMTYRRRRAHG